MKDKFGVELEPGDIVAYGVRSGNSGDLRVGKIVKVHEKGATVQGVEDSWRDGEPPRGLNKGKGQLIYSQRVIAIMNVGQEYLDLLDSVTIPQ